MLSNIKKRLAKYKGRSQNEDEGEFSPPLSPPISPPTPRSNPLETTYPEDRRASEPSTTLSKRPAQVERLSTVPTALTQSSTVGLTDQTRSRSGEKRHDPLGLTIIHEPEETPICDVIFVHGLGGTSRGTWAKGRDPEYCWPQKWLPFESGIGDARILSFGYNANFAAPGSNPITGIADFAKDLLYAMKYAKDENLEDLGLGIKPIIFIVHSMGGLVVKQAYVFAKGDPLYDEMMSSVGGIMFLATPHRGSKLADTLNRVLAASLFTHSPKTYVSEMKHGSPTIEALNEQFRHFAPKLRIFSFFETLPTAIGPKKMIIVEKSSATLGYSNEVSKSLNADHHTVCKFDSNQNSDYISVRNGLKTLITDLCSTDGNQYRTSERFQQEQEQEQLELLVDVGETYQDDLKFFTKRWTKGTCTWILSDPSFQEWTSHHGESPRILWLHALPGSGKSILSSFIVNHLLEEQFCVYYFFRFGDQSKRSLTICLRTIVYQIAKRFPQFRHSLKDARFSDGSIKKADAKWIWDEVFIGVLFKLQLPSTMYWAIDALDESDDFQLLLELMQGTANSSASIKILLVSRKDDDLVSTFDRLSMVVPFVELPVENTQKDIRMSVKQEVQYMKAPEKLKAMIVDRLVAGAHGNFLWASLALTEVMRSNFLEDVDRTLEGMPSGMSGIYKRMESNIIRKIEHRPQDRDLGHLILTWAACSRRPLILGELAQALQPDFSVMLDLQVTISRVCGQFVVVDATDRLIMVHQTARDHLMTTSSVLAVKPADGHPALFKKCIRLIMSKAHLLTQVRGLGDDDLVHYAVSSWAYHINLTSPELDEPLFLLVKFLRGSYVLNWVASLAQQNQLKVLVYSSKIMTLYVRRRRIANRSGINPMLHRLQELEEVESWAVDLLKIVGRFGPLLIANPSSIYELIPPFCPQTSMIYRNFEQNSSSPPALVIQGISRETWDDSLAKISLGPKTQALGVVCSRNAFAVWTGTGNINLYNSTTLDLKETLKHGERICAMSFSTDSNLLATYGFRTTKIWSVKTANVLYQIKNSLGSRAFTIRFAAGNTELIIGSNDRLLRTAKLNVTDPSWSVLHAGLLKQDAVLDRPVHDIPWRMALNFDATSVAVAYRGAPLCVWSLNPPGLPRRCMRSREYAGNAWTVVDQVIWHPKSEEVIGLYMGGQVFRWNPWNDTQKEVQAEGSILASSSDGRFFVVGDSSGTIKLYNFSQFLLIYQLSCENLINDICFSLDSKRLYDLRGQFCNVWEPNALHRADESVEHESEIASESATAVSEAITEIRDPITAIGIRFKAQPQAFGSEAGIVNLVDPVKGDLAPAELCRSELPLPIAHLDWSSDGKYLASAELTGKVVVKRIILHEGPDRRGSTATLVFEVKLQVSPEGITQVLLDNEGDTLLVKNGPSVTVWSLTGSQSDGHNEPTSIISPDTKYLKHPTDAALLLAFSPVQISIHRWTDLSELAVFDIDGTSPISATRRLNRADQSSQQPPTASKISNIFTNASGSHILADTVDTTGTGQEHTLSILETSSLTPPSSRQTTPRLPLSVSPLTLPPQIQQQIEIPLGLLPKRRIIFLDRDYSMCSWHVGANPAVEKVQKYYCLPKDWLNVECLKLCALLADGRFLIPYNGELAIIKSLALSRW